MRTITAPGVEIKEIDRSQYSPAMVGTTCYVMGFANKGEAYQPMEFTSRTAWLNYYGDPDNEAERYFYNACMEVLNQNGRLYCARLPYSNASFEKMVAFKYTLNTANPFSLNPTNGGYSYWDDIKDVDSSVKTAIKITPSASPYLVDLSSVDLYRTDEQKVAKDNFVIVDKTCGAYHKVDESERKGKQREVLGIMPVVTTALQALYAQSLIKVENQNAKYYETCGNVVVQNASNDGIQTPTIEFPTATSDLQLVKNLNSVFKNYSLRFTASQNNELNGHVSTLSDISEAIDVLSQETGLGQNSTLNELLEKYTSDEELGESEYPEADEKAQKIQGWPGLFNAAINNIIMMLAGGKDIKEITDVAILTEIQKYQALLIEDAGRLDLTTLNELSTKVIQALNMINSVLEVHAADGDDSLPETVSFEANSFFPSIGYSTNEKAESGEAAGTFDRDNMKKIGVVVYKIFIDPSEGNKINFEPVEAFAGSLYKNDKDPTTGVSTFIDNIINTTSQYIYFFSNCFNTSADAKMYLGNNPLKKFDTYLIEPTSTCGSLGFFEDQVEEKISVAESIYDGMNKCFAKVEDINERDIDIVPDAGIANIASFIKTIFGEGSGCYDLNLTDDNGNSLIGAWNVNSLNVGVKTWKAVEQKFDTFCKSTRKDCMFIADGLRPLVIQGQKKIVRPSNPKNTIDENILPYIKYLMGLNTSYGAGYLDWFEIADDYSGDMFWCPPSIKAMGSYIYTDVNFNYWDAPAGLTRGIIAASDVAFSPTSKQAGAIYEKNWNYCINYPQDGIVLEGQKTFQVKPTAFDRVNVRRLFLRLERAAYKVARYFVYEGNTAYTRQRLVDALDPYFKEAKIGGGVYDYKILCDETVNTPEVIDRNELKVKIGIKPTKTAEFVLIDFIALTTGGSFDEMM